MNLVVLEAGLVKTATIRRMVINGEMAKYIPVATVGGCRAAKLMTVLSAALLLLALLLAVQLAPVSCKDPVKANKRPVFFSEYKLRSSIVSLNEEIRELKKELMRDVSKIYLNMKHDPIIGFHEAATSRSDGSLALLLIAEEFADLVVKRFVIQRRVLAGLKVAFFKFLPIDTLKRLIDRYQAYDWLKGLNQIDLRQVFPGFQENQYVQLYNLIELRALTRAADDAMALVGDNMKRVINTLQLVALDRRLNIAEEDINRIAMYGAKVLDYYRDRIVNKQLELHNRFEIFLKHSSKLADTIGGQKRFLQFIDKTIDVEALDIELSRAAFSLELPPTTSNQIIRRNSPLWVPKKILDMIDEDRVVLMKNVELTKALIDIDQRWQDGDVADWQAQVSRQLCKSHF